MAKIGTVASVRAAEFVIGRFELFKGTIDPGQNDDIRFVVIESNERGSKVRERELPPTINERNEDELPHEIHAQIG